MKLETETKFVQRGAAVPIRLADGATIALLAIAAWMALVARPPALFLAIGEVLSPLSLIYIAGCVQIVRHLMWPRPSVLLRLKQLHSSIEARAHLAAALRAFFLTRPAVLIASIIAVVTIGLTSTPGFVLSRDPIANLPARFDAGWYGGIALDGYTWDHTFQRQRNIAFFPALPLLMRPAGAVLGMYEEGPPRERRMLRGLWAGTIISLAAFLWALSYVSRLGELLIGADRAATAALLLAAYPFAVYYSAPYTEALFLLGSAGASYHFLRRDWRAASAFGLLAGLSRPNGCFLSVPLAILALQGSTNAAGPSEARSRQRAVQNVHVPPDVKGLLIRLGVAAMPGIGMLLFTVYLYQLTGVWFAWARSHEAWGRSYEGLSPIVSFAGQLRTESWFDLIVNNPFNAINAAGVVFALALTYPVFRKVGSAWGVFVLVNLLPPLVAGGFISMGRLTSTLFPIFLALAAMLPQRSVGGWAAMFGIGQGIAAALFFTWRPLF